MTDQGMQQIVVQQPGQLRTAQGQQIQLQLVTEDGESAGQIFLQMQPEDGTSGQQIEVQQPQHIIQHVQQVDPDMQQQQLMQQQVKSCSCVTSVFALDGENGFHGNNF